MKPHHVRMHAFAINHMPANLTRHIASQIGNRLFQQGFSSLCPPAMSAGFMAAFPAFAPFASP